MALRRFYLMFTLPVCFGIFPLAVKAAGMLDLKEATVLAPLGLSGPERKAVTMLIEEVEKRTRIRFPERADWPPSKVPVIAIGPASLLHQFAGNHLPQLKGLTPPGSEGYHIRAINGSQPAVFVIGNDARGILFGVGRLLRELRM